MSEILDDLFVEKNSQFYQKRRRSRIFVIILLVGMLIATFLSWNEVETIVGSGPILSLLGVVFYFVVRQLNNQLSIIFAFIPLVVSIIWLLIIWTFKLQPNDCVVIVPVSLSILLVVYLVIGIDLLRAFSSLND